MQPLQTIADLDLADRTVLCRVDFNVPLDGDTVTDDTRIRAALPTINALREGGAKVILASHLGRPKGKPNKTMSLLPAGARLAELLETEVWFSHETVGDGVVQLARELPANGVLLIENLRFDPREKAGDEGFAKQLAALADLYVNDAFGAMHRSHASITGVPQHLPCAVGMLVQAEVAAIGGLLNLGPARLPFAAILGGAKVADKIGVIEALSKRVDHLFIGGAMAYTFLAAQGTAVGSSRVESDKLALAAELASTCAQRGVKLHLPTDHVVAETFAADADPSTVMDIPEGFMGLDIGPETLAAWSKTLRTCKTVFWNGPMGVFEWDSFAGGTRGVAEALAGCQAFTVVGGGDSAAAAARFGVTDRVDHVSTGGGASLEYMENGDLVGLQALRS